MPLARLENFLKNLNGNTLYVDPNELDSTDSIENRGNSRTRPFKTIQRALLEAARFSYVSGSNNDLFDQTTILISPGTHYIDNRPGYYWNGSSFRDVNNNLVTITQLSVASDFDLANSSNDLYIYNSAEGGVIVPKGVSLVATDLRKTKIRPKFVPDPANDSIESSAIFRVTGGSYIFGFTVFDGDPVGGVYNTYTTNTVNPTYSHHKLTAFEYADGKNVLTNSPLTDLSNYYYKVSYGFGPFSGREVPDTLTDLQPNPEENKIVGDLGQGPVNISNIISGDGSVASTTITVTTEEDHGLSPSTPISISGVGEDNSVEVQQKYNGNFVVAQVISPTQFTYLVQAPAPAAASPSFTGASVTIQSDTVSSSSPYIFNCSLKSTYGMNGLHADGSKATGFKSIVTAQFTGISLQRDDRAFVKYDETSGTYLSQVDLGTSTTLHQDSRALYKPSWESFHIKASNDAFIQCVSIFAIGYAKQFVAESGGDQSITNSNSNFGAISLASQGFKNFQFRKDDHGFITHIIPPKDIDNTENNIVCYSIDADKTSSEVGNTTKIYLKEYKDRFNPPNQKIRGYTIGARDEDKIYYSGYDQPATISPNYESSYNVNSINTSNSVITVEGSLSGISAGQAVRLIANNAVLPDGIEQHKVYYVSPNSLTSTTIKLRESLSSTTDLVIKTDIGTSPEDNLKLVFRVSDCSPGDPGSPFQYGSGSWYLTISPNASFISNLSGTPDPNFTIKRKIDLRSDDDKVYRVRVVIPKESENASEPTPGFIIQRSSSPVDSIYSSPNNISLSSGSDSPIEIVRNTGVIVDAWTTLSGSTRTANIVTSKPHHLKVGNKITIQNLKSDNEPNPVGLGTGVGFNGEFEVSSVVDNLHFSFIIDRDPGNITKTLSSPTATWLDRRNCSLASYRTPPYTINSSNRDELPFFTCEKLNNDYQAYKIKTIQKYSENESDGIYHIYLNSFKNTPSTSPFDVEKYKLSQNLDNIYPQLDVDNAVSDVNSTISVASRKTIGKVEVNDLKFSTTKETVISYLNDIGNGCGISSITKSGNTCTVTTELDHNINGIRQLTITSAGSGFVNGTYYDIPLCGSTGPGRGATANITVSGGVITSAIISYPGAGYVVGGTVVPRGIPGSTSVAILTISSLTTENLGAVQVLGSLYPENNGTFKITEVTQNTISYTNSSGVEEDPSIAVVLPNIPAYSITAVGSYDSSTDTTQITTENSNPFLPGNKVLFEGLDSAFTVIEVVSTTVFKVSGDVQGSPSTVYSAGLNSQLRDTNSFNENVGSRHIPLFDGFKGRILTALNSTDITSSFTIRLANINANNGLGINKGDFIQVDDEIILINSISGSTATGTRGVLGTKVASHSASSSFRRISVTPIEFRRNSILRASGHTFEYTGFGPGNYSTGMPTNQDRVLSNDEILISQALPTNGGLVVYTGMNSNGEFFIGRKKYDATTGEELSVVELPESDTTFFDNLTINKLTVNNSIDATTANSEFGSVNAGVTTVTDLTVSGVATATSFVGKGTIPVGGIIMWSGTQAQLNSTPEWKLCDGTNGTPDLRNKFIVASNDISKSGITTQTGVAPYEPGDVGGSADAIVVSHNHEITEPNGGQGHKHSITEINGQTGLNGSGNDFTNDGNTLSNIVETDFATTGITIDNEGESGTNKNLPPYYALAFIMRVS